ncbi:thymidine phosphorylase [Streptococcus pneumoniae]|nr:thymidine phosphorylase [Streptococcus pneumoniae]
MRAVDLIQKKRDGQELTSSEIEWLIEGYVSGTVPDYQMSAFAMAVYFRLFVNCSGLKSAKLEKGQILSFLF